MHFILILGKHNFDRGGDFLTVQSDLQQAIAACQTAIGCYASMAQATEDQQTKQMYEKMETDVDSHLQFLEGRLDYLNQHNQLNQ